MSIRQQAGAVFSWLLQLCRAEPAAGSIGEFLQMYDEFHSHIEADLIDCSGPLAKELASFIDDYVHDCNSVGKTPFLYRDSVSPELVLSGIRVLKSDTEEERARKALLADITLILDSLHKLSPTAFERFVCVALRKAGIPVRQTSLTRDGGVDFLAESTVSISPRLASAKYSWVTFELIGQAKRYKPTACIGPDKIRELIGATVLSAQRRSKPKAASNSVLPRVCMFVTTAGLSSAAWDDARAAGCIVLDGQLIAEFLIDVFLGAVHDDYSGLRSREMLAWYAA